MRAGILPKLLISPSVLLVLVCVYGYIMFTAYLSFTSSTLMPSFEWAGTASYHRLFSLENWSVSIDNLFVFATLYIGIASILGLGLAIMIDQHVRAEGLFRSVFLYPMALSFIVTGTAWKWLLDPGVGLEHSLHAMGWESFGFNWIKDGDMAIYCVVIAAVWQTTGFVMAMFIAGLRGVDAEVVNAARMDGARAWQIYHPATRAGLRLGVRDPGPHGDQVLRPRHRADEWRSGPLDLVALGVHVPVHVHPKRDVGRRRQRGADAGRHFGRRAALSGRRISEGEAWLA
jgi:ABC-type sugar transport system permease subunit